MTWSQHLSVVAGRRARVRAMPTRNMFAEWKLHVARWLERRSRADDSSCGVCAAEGVTSSGWLVMHRALRGV